MSRLIAAQLVGQLTEAAEAGSWAPCLADPQPFTSDDVEDRAAAATACTWCPGRVACARFALAADVRAWVWGGVDITPHHDSTVPSPLVLARLEAVALCS